MDTIKTLIIILQALILVAAGPRAVICFQKISTDSEQASLYKRRLKNLLVFVAISVSGLQLLSVIFSAYLS